MRPGGAAQPAARPHCGIRNERRSKGLGLEYQHVYLTEPDRLYSHVGARE
jgi:hypothetical protein